MIVTHLEIVVLTSVDATKGDCSTSQLCAVVTSFFRRDAHFARFSVNSLHTWLPASASRSSRTARTRTNSSLACHANAEMGTRSVLLAKRSASSSCVMAARTAFVDVNDSSASCRAFHVPVRVATSACRSTRRATRAFRESRRHFAAAEWCSSPRRWSSTTLQDRAVSRQSHSHSASRFTDVPRVLPMCRRTRRN